MISLSLSDIKIMDFHKLCREMQLNPAFYQHCIALEIPSDTPYHSPGSDSIQRDICQSLESQMLVPEQIKGLQYISDKVILLTLNAQSENMEYFKILLVQYFHNKFCGGDKTVKIFHPKLVGPSQVDAIVTGIPLPAAETGFQDLQKQIPRKFPYLTDIKAKFIEMKSGGSHAGDVLIQAKTNDLLLVHQDLCVGRTVPCESLKGIITYKSPDQIRSIL